MWASCGVEEKSGAGLVSHSTWHKTYTSRGRFHFRHLVPADFLIPAAANDAKVSRTVDPR